MTVHNYWEEHPRAWATPETVKWLALTRREPDAMLLVLASWSEAPVTATVRFDGALAGRRVSDAETGETLAESAATTLAVPLAGPWGNRVLRIEPARGEPN